jgi:hypothetical protein
MFLGLFIQFLKDGILFGGKFLEFGVNIFCIETIQTFPG